jgi:hypothetical protein
MNVQPSICSAHQEACPWDCHIDGERKRLRLEIDRLRTAIEATLRMFPCPCEPAWRDRDMHAPNCVWIDLDDLRDALRPTPPQPTEPK